MKTYIRNFNGKDYNYTEVTSLGKKKYVETVENGIKSTDVYELVSYRFLFWNIKKWIPTENIVQKEVEIRYERTDND